MTSHQTKQVKIKTARMEIIRQTHIEETKATLKKEDFIISEETPTTRSFKPFQLSSWLTLSWKYWAVIAALSTVAIAVILAIICKCYRFPTISKNHTSAAPPASITAVFNNQATNTATSAAQPTPEITQAPSQQLPAPIAAVQEETNSPRPT